MSGLEAHRKPTEILGIQCIRPVTVPSFEGLVTRLTAYISSKTRMFSEKIRTLEKFAHISAEKSARGTEIEIGSEFRQYG